MFRFFRRLFGTRKGGRLPSVGMGADRTLPASAAFSSEQHVRRIASHEMSFPLMGSEPRCQLGDFVAQDEPYRVGDRIGGMHKVVEVLGGSGKTGMGVVYVCERYGEGTWFVLKTFQDRFLRHASVREAFQREAVNHVRLGWHPHIVTANTVLVLDGRPFIDMLYVPPDADGRRSLADHFAAMAPGRPFPPELACRLAIQVCYGMEHAAALGITPHQDLKPGNVLLAEGWLAKVADFGLARAAAEELSAWGKTSLGPGRVGSASLVPTKRGTYVVGTPPWMSPEHFDGRTDQRSDIYAMGIILFQMAYGRYPYRSTDWEYAHRNEPAPPLDGPFASVVHRALAKDPDRRYQTFSEMRHDLETVYRRLTGNEYPSLDRAFREMGVVQNCLGGWGKPGAIDHLVNLARALHNLGHDDEAEPLLRRALQIQPESALVHVSLGLVLRQRGAIHEALPHFDYGAKQCPDDPLLLHNMATTYLMAERCREALPLFDEALKLAPSLPGLWADKALCLERLGLYEQALATVEHALAQAPRDPKCWLLKAQILIGMKDGPRALGAVAEARRLAATNDIAELCHELERQAAALAQTSESKHGRAHGGPSPVELRAVEFPYTIPLSSERRKQIMALLQRLKRPSKQITTAELAAAVIGEAAGPLPTWAHDRQFESELEGLLKCHMVWVCPDCDGIIGFLDVPPGENQGRLIRDLVLVQSQDRRLGCPVCGSKNIAWCNPEVLRWGEKLDHKGHLRGLQGPDSG